MEKNNLLNEENQADISSLMDVILKKYSLEEDPNKMYQKIKDEKRPNKTIISYLAKDFAENKIDEKSFLLSLQKQLLLSEEISKKIIYDIKSIYLPPLKKILERKKNIANITDKHETKNKFETAEKLIGKSGEPLEISEQKKEKDSPPKKPVQDKKAKSSGPNKYREPIE